MITHPRRQPAKRISQSFVTRGATPYKFNAIHFVAFPGLEVLVDIPLIHPLGDQGQPVLVDHRAKEWENIWVAKVLPHHDFFAESLYITSSAGIAITVTGNDTHAKGLIKLLRDMEPYNLDGDFSTLEHVLVYWGRIPIHPHL